MTKIVHFLKIIFYFILLNYQDFGIKIDIIIESKLSKYLNLPIIGSNIYKKLE